MSTQRWKSGQPEFVPPPTLKGSEWPTYQNEGRQRTGSNSYIGYQPQQTNTQDQSHAHLPCFGSVQPAATQLNEISTKTIQQQEFVYPSGTPQPIQQQQIIQSPVPLKMLNTNTTFQVQQPQTQQTTNSHNQQFFQRSSAQPGPYFQPVQQYQAHQGDYQPTGQQYQAYNNSKNINPNNGNYSQNDHHRHPQQRKKPTSNAHCRGFDTRQISMKQSIMFLDLYNFKIDQCQQDPQNHNLKRCPFYHDYYKDRRRPLGTYQSEICPFVTGKQSTCQKGDACERAHNRVEEFYHPDKYKAKFCSSYLETGGQPCEYQEYCSFAHNESELSIELIEKFDIDMDFYMFHFKTVWCPYREDDHDRKICVYAHNWQDFRRRPSLFMYSSKMCPQWQVNNFISSYAEGCPNQYQCQYSHGWKEQEYHPDFLKIKQCQHGINCMKSHCPYYHNESDRQLAIAKWFKFFPKTRVSSFQTNFYLDSYGTKQNHMANKQTSFSSLPTEIICNANRLDKCRGYSPDSNISTSGNTQTSNIRMQKQQTMRSNTNSSSSRPMDLGSNNSTSKRKGRKQAYSKQSQNSSNSSHYQIQQQNQHNSNQQQNQSYGSQPTQVEFGSLPSHNHSIGNQSMQHQQVFVKKQQVDPHVKLFQPIIVQNHFQNLQNKNNDQPPQALFSHSPVPQHQTGAIKVATLPSALVESPTKGSSPSQSNQSYSMSNRESNSGSATYSASSANLGQHQNRTIQEPRLINQHSSFVAPQKPKLSPQEVSQRHFSGNASQIPQVIVQTETVDPADLYWVNNRTTSYGQDKTSQANALFVSGNFGPKVATNSNYQADMLQQQVFGQRPGSQVMDQNTQSVFENQNNSGINHQAMTSNQVINNQTDGLLKSGILQQASPGLPQSMQSLNSHSSQNRLSDPISSSTEQLQAPEETKQVIKNHEPIVEEESSDYLSDQEKNKKSSGQGNSTTKKDNDVHKKGGFITKMRKSLKKLQIIKNNSDESVPNQDQGVERNLSKDAIDTYHGVHPKSATIRNVQNKNLDRRTSHLVPMKAGTEILHSIQEEENQNLESSQKQKQSKSLRNVRPGTPEFIQGVVEGQSSSEASDGDQEQTQIRARMEAQIQGFDDEI